MFNSFYNKNQIRDGLLDLSRDITSHVTMFREIDDISYMMKVSDVQSRFLNIVGYQNSSVSSMLSSKIMMINSGRNKTNAIKLLELSNAVLEMGRYIK